MSALRWTRCDHCPLCRGAGVLGWTVEGSVPCRSCTGLGLLVIAPAAIRDAAIQLLRDAADGNAVPMVLPRFEIDRLLELAELTVGHTPGDDDGARTLEKLVAKEKSR